MTRANLNFTWQEWGSSPKTLYHYHNGDQYPRGLRDYFGIVEWLENGKFTPEGFSEWIKKNYQEQGYVREGVIEYIASLEKPAKPVGIDHPCINYDDEGFPTDYSYVFDAATRIARASVLVYHWQECIFQGSVQEFLTWLKQQKKP